MVLDEVRLWNGLNNEGERVNGGAKVPELMVLELILDAICKGHQQQRPVINALHDSLHKWLPHMMHEPFITLTIGTKYSIACLQWP